MVGMIQLNRHLDEACVYVYLLLITYMSKASDREEIKDETYQVQDDEEEQEELDDEEEDEREEDTFSNKDRSKK